ncbi:DUF6517 family protein [Natrinema longum]|uniref:Uncharacterized protein n=1 Tax=Natrinema longum TaxID=370324 RepID=A0A8A2U9M7_9EURY|nr:DUF6517 family protein [Natrinema longum]MBZ6496700.1 hypothetical protein [Natrinema longum]QSW85406.1 hypothetical protein J0X27_00710 [Natrinema longum]
MKRRLFIGVLAAGGVGTAAGCLSGIADEATTFTAAPARVDEDAAGEVGYEYQGTRRRVDEEEVGGEDIEATSYLSLYDRSIELPTEQFGDDPLRAGVFGVITTPQVSIAGEDFNPVSDLSNRELADRIQGHYEGLELDRAVGGRALDALGERFPIQSYGGTATLQNQYAIDVTLDIVQREHEDDHIVVAAIYPTDDLLPEGSEQPRIDTLVQGLESYDDLEVEIVEGGDWNGSTDS